MRPNEQASTPAHKHARHRSERVKAALPRHFLHSAHHPVSMWHGGEGSLKSLSTSLSAQKPNAEEPPSTAPGSSNDDNPS